LLDLVEKIVMGVASLLILGTVAFYFLFGFPSTTSIEFVPAVVDEPAPAAAATPPTSGTPEAPQPVTPQDQETIQKLAEQGVKVPAGQGIVKERKNIPEDLLEFVSKEANFMPELKKLKRSILPGGKRMKLTEIPQNSLLKKFGIQQGDVIELIDGEIIEFKDDQVLEYHQIFKEKIKKVREGQPISITVTRSNRPLQIIFKL
jgi:membrane-associated protease RseP (regulator of RpoE activity)